MLKSQIINPIDTKSSILIIYFLFIKTLNTQDLLTLASEAKIDAEKSNKEVNSQKKSKNNSKNIEVKDTLGLVKAIKKSL
ncbi:hypothetical protein [Borreliella burgdorferi]|uniref:Uncharacterized protein n=2 Tax=Borreliella burgdorferi TaxID=139 RepID=A0A7U3YBR9_BORBG|nr:hypothetical protein [Borreliella burgdorferi]ACK75271.1 conserved hypothetical protein [Borreliella burgdorferi ZS7]ACL34295.1 conserved hypothetical protein [Borreliella burgdorferi 156a]ACM10449.1 conserved hypothetical protein [Borreliella burgdorferi 72a]ACN56153.1 conserved hypothetical protein [Borreliella burgdorferi CA-11.2A]ACN92062.1 conserved hypothetical protein [Borreliella burgdorferi 94a]